MRLILPIFAFLLLGCSLSAQTVVDFTTMSDANTHGTHSQVQIGGVWAMWGGDANGDGTVLFNAANSDGNAVKNAVLSDPGNTGFFGSGPVTTYANRSMYETNDTTLDGNTLDNSSNSDTNFILSVVLSHPGNTGFFGSGAVSTYTGVVEQLPQ
ncbi:MAG: hypothetical protein AAF738_02790 [Bacteroidota bacterium]